MEITMKRHNRAELERAIEDNIKRGFTVVGQIHEITRGYRNFKYDNYRKKYDEFSHTDDNTLYCVKMRGEKR
ncbi:hypothetical protein MKX72_20320 [Priestia sp. FSL R5-0597]|uniref:hypothetical protein n=1 Tax=Priestia sp. FSL R5-0597 TaxID=2921580 RepID=UPI0030FCC21D